MGPSDAQLLRAYDQAPQAIQDSLSDGLALDFMTSLVARYGLHMDTAGYVSEFIRNMLLGFLRPEQFIGKLASVGLTNDTAHRLTADLNKEVFLPLRDEILGTGVSAHSIPRVAVMHVAEVAKHAVVAPAASAEKISEVPSFNLMRETSEKISDIASQLPQVDVSAAALSTAPVPTMRTMQHDMNLVQHGSIPAPYEAPTSQLHPDQTSPARIFQTASVPVSIPGTPSTPREMVHIIPDAAQSGFARTLPIAPPPQPSSDPYRESI